MRKTNLLIGLIALYSLSGCKFIDRFFPKKPVPQEEKTDQEEVVEKTKVGEFYGGESSDSKYVGYEFSKSQGDLVKPTSGVGEINIYAFNDFHGSVVETSNEVGIKKLGSFFKNKSQEENTLILDQGDTWQGSFESNYTYGTLVQDVFNYAGVSLRTVGNHDFDWGLNHLEETASRKTGDDYIPCLASNVYDYSNGKNGTKQQSQFGKEYATFTLDNGIKVGVVGVIGEGQITSISSQLVQTICFTNHVQKIKEVSDYLRIDKKCDIVIASTHESSSNMYTTGLDEISTKSNKRYADLVLSGHAHYLQNYTKNGVKYVQWDSNGESTGLIKLKYDFATQSLLYNETEVSTYYNNSSIFTNLTLDQTITRMVDDYLVGIEPKANEVLSTNFSGYWSTTSLAYLMSEAIYYSAKSLGKTVDFSVSNSARASFKNNTFTYRDLYKCFPFDNEIILMDVSSARSCNSISSYDTYKEDTSKYPSAGNTYHVAVIDYVGLHQNFYREYDTFPDASNIEVLKDENGNSIYYRDALRSYLLDNKTKEFNASDYTSSNPHFSF